MVESPVELNFVYSLHSNNFFSIFPLPSLVFSSLFFLYSHAERLPECVFYWFCHIQSSPCSEYDRCYLNKQSISEKTALSLFHVGSVRAESTCYLAYEDHIFLWEIRPFMFYCIPKFNLYSFYNNFLLILRCRQRHIC